MMMIRRMSLLSATVAAVLIIGGAAPGWAQENDALADFKSLKTDVALDAATAALQACRDQGYQVAVAVVDRWGLTQAVVRDRFAGPHTVDTATRKAWTAVSFRTSTLELDETIRSEPRMVALRDVTGALALGGGVPILAAGSIVAGIGVSGAPNPGLDDDCAQSAIQTIQDRLDF